MLLLLACKDPGGTGMTQGTGGESTSTGITSINLTSSTDPTTGAIR